MYSQQAAVLVGRVVVVVMVFPVAVVPVAVVSKLTLLPFQLLWEADIFEVN
jgi:hypothetical protein